MNIRTTVAIAFIILCIASSCTKKLDGSGNIISQERPVQVFSGIENHGPFRVIINKGESYSLTIEGEDNILPEIETSVVNGILKVDYRRQNVHLIHGKVVVKVTTPAINKLMLHGSGEIESNALWTTPIGFIHVSGSGYIRVSMNAEKLKTIISGSGKMYISGTTSEGDYNLTGSGNFHGYELVNKSATSSISGSGKCELFVMDNLSANIKGTGSIYYTGNPARVDVAVSGTGKVVKL